MSADSNHDFARDLVAAGKRERPSEAARARVVDQVLAELRAVPAASHEGHLVQLVAKERRKFRAMSAAFASAFLVAASMGGLYIKSQSDERERAAAAAAAELMASQQQLASLNMQLAAQNAQVDAAQAALANAKDESARLSAQAQLMAAESAVQQTKATFSRVRSASSSATKPMAACTCNHSDPLCGCL